METLLCLGSGACAALGVWALAGSGRDRLRPRGEGVRALDAIGWLHNLCASLPMVAFGKTDYCRRMADELVRDAKLGALGLGRGRRRGRCPGRCRSWRRSRRGGRGLGGQLRRPRCQVR